MGTSVGHGASQCREPESVERPITPHPWSHRLARSGHRPFKSEIVGSNPTGTTGDVSCLLRRGMEQFGSSLGS